LCIAFSIIFAGVAPVEYHDTILRVRYAETDRMDFVYYSRYFEYFEVGRAEHMRAKGAAYSDLESEGIKLAVVEATARYKAPAKYDDEIRIRTRITRFTKTRVFFEYKITPKGSDRVLVEGSTEHACIDDDGRPRRIPEKVIKVLGLEEGIRDKGRGE
jgi:acyl-CoA thioester hydrolase